jgi:[ribosomal protein S18]-alanine N-acetyltransferase
MSGPVETLRPPVEERDRKAILALEMASQQRPLGWEALACELDDGTMRTTTLVARDDDGRIIGHASARRLVDDVHVVRLVVDAGQRRQGIGAALLAGLVGWTGRAGAPRITLEVRAGNAAARALYSRAGFVECGRRPGYYPDGEAAVVCTRELVPAPSGGS